MKDIRQKQAPSQEKKVPASKSRPSYIDEQSYDLPMDDSLLPSLKIIQSISPERIKGSEVYVEGAVEGMLMHSTSLELFDGDTGVIIVPLAVRKYWVEWKSRDSGGGFVASYSTKEDMDKGFTPGNEVQVTIEYMVMMEATKQMVTVRFNSATKYAIARKWATMIEQAKTLFGKKYRLKTVMKKNKNNQIYFNYDIEPVDWVDETTYKIVKELAASAQLPAIEQADDNEL